MKRIAPSVPNAAVVALLVLLAGTACGGDSPTIPIDRPDVSVVVTPATHTLMPGQQFTFTAVVHNDTTGPLSGVTWSSSNNGVISIDGATGVATAVTPGQATIRAMSRLSPTRLGISNVTVTTSSALSVSVSPASPTLTVGQQSTLQATVANDTTGPLSGVTWMSSNAAIVTVNPATGAVQAVGRGEALVTATSRWKPEVSGSATVKVVSVFTILGRASVNERYTAEIAAAGNYAYTTTWGTRGLNRGDVIKVWNITGNTPVAIDSLKIPGVGTIGDVQISPDGSLLVVSTELLGTGSIAIYSLATPARPTFINRLQNTTTARGIHTVKLSTINGRLWAFLQVNRNPAALYIVDITNPAAPMGAFYQEMGQPTIHDVFVRDGLLFTALWNGGMTIFDVGGGGRGSPSNPVLISNIKTPTGQIHNIWWVHDPTTGSKRYAILGEEGDGGGPEGNTSSGDVHVIDVSDMAAPRQVAIYSVPGAGTHNFFVDEPSGILYAAYYTGGVRALDVRGDLGTCTAAQRVQSGAYSGLCDMRLMGREVASTLTTGAYIWGVAMIGNRLFASDMADGIVALDISTMKR